VRIRSIKPEFWRSDDVDALDLPTRLLFIGLWSYVDDNGVGIDKLSSIAADLFAGDMERDPRDTLARISGGLATLSERGMIDRYKVDRKAFLYVTAWTSHQRIDKPAKPRFPLPTCENAIPRDTVATLSRDLRETPATGTEEQGNRGTEEQAPQSDAGFDEFWSRYPRKIGKGTAVKAWKAAAKKADADAILSGLDAHLPIWAKTEAKFIPHAATWLNGERWTDEVDVPKLRVDRRPEGW
jgi:hypothetical protein